MTVFRDDIHVMVYMDGHPEFEAVEAMIRFVNDESPIVRAIVTLHDQSQIDHTNDTSVRDATSVGGRRVVTTDVSASVVRQAARIHARVSFAAYSGEVIDLRFVGAGLPHADHSGLSDPGGHSSRLSLPIMWREKSTVGIDGSCVHVGDKAYDATVLRQVTADYAIRRAYLTEGHRMAVIRAGNRKIARRKSSEISPRLLDRLVFTSPDAALQFSIVFIGGAFRCDLGEVEGIVTGEAWTEKGDACWTLVLQPQSPAWAVERRVVVRIEEAEGSYDIATTIG
ncbi:hypothetical protein [Variibacter gotjawalensis]|uniref:hypothetical protein n=1 Tax=Variibacter gotjawalensis TaxID=1333996 RepID=UPI00102D03A5|nr:hypothetical protein [Variibacter gotjawalensis]NIK46674.1 hypothetical protein [Variibacter gotjawalensis]